MTARRHLPPPTRFGPNALQTKSAAGAQPAAFGGGSKLMAPPPPPVSVPQTGFTRPNGIPGMVQRKPANASVGPSWLRASPAPPPTVARTGVLQRAQLPGGAPPNLWTGGYQISTWQQHQTAIKGGADQIGLRLYELNPNPVSAAKAQTLIIPTPSIHNRDDQPHAILSIENLEQHVWTNTKRIHGHLSTGGKISSDLAKQTESIGETAAYNGFAQKYPNFQLCFAIDPGHGTGIDQLWKKVNHDGTPNTFMVVEAKGPKAKLSKGQMSEAWVTAKLRLFSNSSDLTVAFDGDLAYLAIGLAGNGGNVPYVKGCVCTARWNTNSSALTYSVSHVRNYN
jgi:hypothetical protein